MLSTLLCVTRCPQRSASRKRVRGSALVRCLAACAAARDSFNLTCIVQLRFVRKFVASTTRHSLGRRHTAQLCARLAARSHSAGSSSTQHLATMLKRKLTAKCTNCRWVLFLVISCAEARSLTTHLQRPLEWYPGGVAFQTTLAKQQLRKVPALKPLHSFMVGMETAGHVSFGCCRSRLHRI